MKKLILSAIAVIAFANANAQEKGFYVKLQTGYNFSTNSQVGTKSTINYTGTLSNNQKVTTTDNSYYSLGKGLNVGVEGGYMFNKYVGTELGINYLLGSKTEFSNNTNYNNYDSQTVLGQTIITTRIGYSNTNRDLSAKMLQVRPALVLTGGFDKINPYAKFGVIFGFGTTITENYNRSTDYTSRSTTNNIETYKTITNESAQSSIEYSGNTAIGFNAATGLEYNLNDKLSLFGEITLQSLSYSPSKGSLTKYYVNGKDTLGDLKVSEKEFEYSDSISSDDNKDSNKATKQLATNYAFSSIGVNVGVKYKF